MARRAAWKGAETSRDAAQAVSRDAKNLREKILNALAPDEALTAQRASENRSSKLDPPTVRTTLDNWACVAVPPLNSFCASAS